jgi:hypothetical protein
MEDKGIDERIILKSILRKLGRRMLTGFIWLRIQTNGEIIVMELKCT